MKEDWTLIEYNGGKRYERVFHDVDFCITELNKYAFEFAVSNMYKKSASGEEEKITPYTKVKIDELLANYGIKIKNFTHNL